MVTHLVYWRAIALADFGRHSELTRLIMRGDKFPAEYEPRLVALMNGARKPRRLREPKFRLDPLEAPVARTLFKALTSASLTDSVKQVRRFIRVVTSELPHDSGGLNRPVAGNAYKAGNVEVRTPQNARPAPVDPASTAPMTETEAIARMMELFACSEGAVWRAVRLKASTGRKMFQKIERRDYVSVFNSRHRSQAPTSEAASAP